MVVAQGLRNSNGLSLTGPYLDASPLPNYDHFGYKVAMQVVNESRKRGHNAIDHKKCDLIQMLWKAYSNHVRASAGTNTEPIAIRE
jgi:hypothetical protein